jgi:hypothetical protein
LFFFLFLVVSRFFLPSVSWGSWAFDPCVQPHLLRLVVEIWPDSSLWIGEYERIKRIKWRKEKTHSSELDEIRYEGEFGGEVWWMGEWGGGFVEGESSFLFVLSSIAKMLTTFRFDSTAHPLEHVYESHSLGAFGGADLSY